MAQAFTMKDLKERLQARQHKMTPQRQTVLQIFLEHPGEHLSAEDVHGILRDKKSEIGLATVYRSLARFKRQGLIQSLGTVNGIERFDGNPNPHVHFVCTQCSALVDLHQMDAPQTLCHQAAEHLGGQVDFCQLMFYGPCQSCLNQQKEA